jgi:type 1 glutamine amidotransferase
MLCRLLACLALLAPVLAPAKPPTEEMLSKIGAALPEAPQAKPARARKILIFSATRGFRHSSIETGAEALRQMGSKTGAYAADHTEDPAVFTRENLAQYDAVVFLNTTGSPFNPAADKNASPEQKAGAAEVYQARKDAFMEFIKSGKGFVGIHSATDTFYDWKEYGEMIGGYFDGHPWHEKVTLVVEDTSHPCNHCFGGKDRFEVTDEIYQYRAEPWSRRILRVLTRLDTEKTKMDKKGIKRTDGDFGVSWVKTHGAGRIFQCSLGHREEIYWNPVVLKHYLAGIQFAIGDLPADATPTKLAP